MPATEPAADASESTTESATTGSENFTDTTADAATPEAPASGDCADTVGATVSPVVNGHDEAITTLPAVSRAPDSDAVYRVPDRIGADGVNVAVAVAVS